MEIDIATFAAGCFWDVQKSFDKLVGVLSTQVGYTGGIIANPTYEMVCSHQTEHAEAVQIEFNSQIIPATVFYRAEEYHQHYLEKKEDQAYEKNKA